MVLNNFYPDVSDALRDDIDDTISISNLAESTETTEVMETTIVLAGEPGLIPDEVVKLDAEGGLS